MKTISSVIARNEVTKQSRSGRNHIGTSMTGLLRCARKDTGTWFAGIAVVFVAFMVASCAPAAPTAAPAPASPTASPAGKPSAQQQWDRTLESARKEGTILVYSSNGPALRNGLAAIARDKFGLQMEFVAGNPTEIYQKYLTEHRVNLHYGDLYMSGTNIVADLKREGVLLPLDDKFILPEVANPRAWPEGHPRFLENDHIAVALTGAYWSYILVNTDLVKETDLKAYADLVDPRWKGKLSMYRPAGSGAGVNWVMFIREMAMGAEASDRFFAQLAIQEPVISSDTRQLTEWAARGKYPIAIAPSSIDVVAEFQKAGAPIAWRRMAEGGFIHPAGSLVALLKDAPHPKAALVIFNWLLTEEGQAFFSEAYSQPPVRLGVTVKGIDPFTIPKPGERVFVWNEEFGRKTNQEGSKVGQKFFGSLMK